MTFEEQLSLHDKQIKNIVGYFISSGHAWSLSPDQVHQAALIGFWQGWLTYDATKGTTLWTHAYSRIKGEIIDEVRRTKVAPRRRNIQWTNTEDVPERCYEDNHETWVEDRINRMSGRLRDIMALYFLRDETVMDITRRLGVTDGTVCYYLNKGRKALSSIGRHEWH
jgi:RNA polymerase sigma factor (sigma-70 family)